jgi:hypothetical protein
MRQHLITSIDYAKSKKLPNAQDLMLRLMVIGALVGLLVRRPFVRR